MLPMQEWQVDVPGQEASHVSGLKIRFEGTPQSRFFEGSPGKVPDGVKPMDLVRLIREGYEAYEKAWLSQRRDSAPECSASPSMPMNELPGTASTSDGEGAVPIIRKKRRRRIVSE